MVDALREAGRVLSPGGTVVDLRPVSAPVTIQAQSAARTGAAIEIASYGAAEDDAAADAAVRQALSRQWLTLERQLTFAVDIDCDTASDLREFAETGRRMREANIPYEALERQRIELGAATGDVARLRCRRPTVLSVYRKL